MKKYYFIFYFIGICITSYAQKKKSNWSIGTNPLSLGESQMSIGPCFSYGLSKKVELWGEASLIFANAYMPEKWEKMTGLRFLFQPRYLIGEDNSTFIAPEFRIKNFRFKNNLEFINASSHDTLKNFRFTETQLLIGGGIVFGKRYVISEKHHMMMELTAGIGGKQRYIKRKGIPFGYDYNITTGGFGLAPHYEYSNDGTVYFPIGCRMIWEL